MNLADDLPIVLPTLLETRLLVQANSGGGKSWALRRLLEQTARGVQQLVIDPEGEFATLRECFDYVIAAPHGADAVASPQTAALLARRLLETGVSAILDIYDLKAHDRQLFVQRFLEALVNAPRNLWHPVLLVIDEAHVFCPQNGRTEARPAVIDVCTRGRKRGLCPVLATQRLSKLHKDAAAEMLNKLIGRTGLDVDVKRAADELGMSPREAMEQLRGLPAGTFWAFGPALTPTVQRAQIGAVKTTHPKVGDRLMSAPPAPSPRILASLAKLADLQHEAEEEARTVEELKARNAELQRLAADLRAQEAGVPEVEVEKRIAAAVAQVREELSEAATAGEAERALRAVVEHVNQIGVIAREALDAEPPSPSTKQAEVVSSPSIAPADVAAPAEVHEGVNAAQQKILDVLAQLEAYGVVPAAKATVAAHAGVSPKSGGYFNNLGRLRTAGLIDYPAGGTAALTDAGRAKANPPVKALTLADLHESWFRILPVPMATILRAVVAAYPRSITRDELADQIGVSRTSGGYFNNLGRLRTLGAITYPRSGAVRAAEILFPARVGVEASNGALD